MENVEKQVIYGVDDELKNNPKYILNIQPLTKEQKEHFKPYIVENVSDIIRLLASALKNKDENTLIEIHDKLLISDITLCYDVLIVMINLSEKHNNNNMYSDFVKYTEKSKILIKGVYHRCIRAIGFYGFKKGFENPYLGYEFYPTFGEGLNGIVIGDYRNIDIHKEYEIRMKYREYIENKYQNLIQELLNIS